MSRRYLTNSSFENKQQIVKEYKNSNENIGRRIKSKRSSTRIEITDKKGNIKTTTLTQTDLFKDIIELESGKITKDNVKSHARSVEQGKQKIYPYELAYIADELDTTVESFFTDEPIYKTNPLEKTCVDTYREHVHDPALDNYFSTKINFAQLSMSDFDFTGKIVSIYLERKLDMAVTSKGNAKILNCIFLLINMLLANQYIQPDSLSYFSHILEQLLFNDKYSESYINEIIQTISKDSEFLESLQVIIPEPDDIQDKNDLNE